MKNNPLPLNKLNKVQNPNNNFRLSYLKKSNKNIIGNFNSY